MRLVGQYKMRHNQYYANIKGPHTNMNSKNSLKVLLIDYNLEPHKFSSHTFKTIT